MERRPRVHGGSLSGGSVQAFALVWVAPGSSWRNTDGSLTGGGVVPLSVALAAFASTVTARTAYGAAVRWFSLALVGQAATLQLIDAGHLLRYQHYRPLETLASEQPEFLAVLAVQAILVVVALLRWDGRAWSRMAPLSRPRRAVALLLSVATAATVSPNPLSYVSELSFAASLQVRALATILLGALALPDSCVDWAERTTTRLFGPAPRPRGVRMAGIGSVGSQAQRPRSLRRHSPSSATSDIRTCPTRSFTFCTPATLLRA